MCSQGGKNRRPDDKGINPRHRLIFIVACSVLMATLVYLIGESVQEGQRQALLQAPPGASAGSIPVEAGVFRQAKRALSYQQAGDIRVGKKRQLAGFYALRAFPGAPPRIPHPVQDETSYGGNTCLQCHEFGGYVPKFDAYAPVVPHPELFSCRQCHVPKVTESIFRGNRFRSAPAPAIHRSELPGSPPVIPHELQMRENCLACHAGPGAVEEIRVTHPERVNCRQCHMLQQENSLWQGGSLR